MCGPGIELFESWEEDEKMSKKIKYFSAEWCGPCKMFKPIMKEIADEGHTVEFIDLDTNPNQAHEYGVRSVPTTIIVDGDTVVNRFVGAVPKDIILNEVK
tara:strand:+ start:4050 stop:4349 length:300 start_codon:yes stop_codon:yes gene_type:complete